MPTDLKVLFPVDVAHAHPEYALQLNQLLPVKGAKVHILSVREELPAIEHTLRTLGHSIDEFNNSASAKAKEILSSLDKSFSNLGAQVSQEIVGGPAAMMIEKVARDEGFKVTAVPPGGRKTLDKYLLGRVSGKLVQHAPGLVLLLRGDAEAKLRSVVIGLDGSKASLNALRDAAQIFAFAERGIKVTLVNVVSLNSYLTMVSPIEYISAIESNLRMSGEAVLAEGEKVLADLSVKDVTMKQVEGNAAESLNKCAQEAGATLIVVGAQGKGMVEHFLVGSTSSRLADLATCSVAVFKESNGKA